MARLINWIKQLGFLRIGVLPPPGTAEDERLLHLFRNRAELKKSYSSLQDELQKLKDRIKQQEGATARVQEMLQGLEARLGSSETAYPAVVFYQLRELWSLGRTLLTQFTAELAAQQEGRERRAFFAEHNQRQFARRQTVDATLREAESRAAEGRSAVSALEQQLMELRRIWHYFKRRSLRAQLQAANLQALLYIQDLEAARSAREALEAEPAPEFGGVSVEARRAINLATIGYGQVLCDRLARSPLLEQTREAAARREPPREDYGDRAHCEALMMEIGRGRVLLQQRSNLPAEIKQRADRLRELAKYRNATDTVPTAESLATPDGSRVLVDDLWEIYRVLLR